ncbi:MAG: hypothetical protein RI973_1727 [Bacteroidota bacterium]|jgi:hypothetical protein
MQGNVLLAALKRAWGCLKRFSAFFKFVPPVPIGSWKGRWAGHRPVHRLEGFLGRGLRAAPFPGGQRSLQEVLSSYEN